MKSYTSSCLVLALAAGLMMALRPALGLTKAIVFLLLMATFSLLRLVWPLPKVDGYEVDRLELLCNTYAIGGLVGILSVTANRHWHMSHGLAIAAGLTMGGMVVGFATSKGATLGIRRRWSTLVALITAIGTNTLMMELPPVVAWHLVGTTVVSLLMLVILAHRHPEWFEAP